MINMARNSMRNQLPSGWTVEFPPNSDVLPCRVPYENSWIDDSAAITNQQSFSHSFNVVPADLVHAVRLRCWALASTGRVF